MGSRAVARGVVLAVAVRMGGERRAARDRDETTKHENAESTPDAAIGKSALAEDGAGPAAAASDAGATRGGEARVVARIVGHASPRWRQPGASKRDELNLALSRQRAEVVQIELESLFAGVLPEADAQCRSAVVDEHDGISYGVEARGSKDTIGEANGDHELDEQRLRRVEIAVEVHRVHRGVNRQSSSKTREVKPRVYDATDQWRVRMLIGGGAHAVLGGSAYLAFLINEATGKMATCSFIGAGVGAGEKSKWSKGGSAVPTVDTFDSGTSFRTNRFVTFDDFNMAPARIMDMSVNAVIGGWSLAYLRFPTLCDDAIDIGGFEQGGLGAGAEADVGVWNVLTPPPKPPPRKVREDVTLEDPYEQPVKQLFRHTVYFELQKSSLDPVQRDLLAIFAEGVAAGTEGKTIMRAQPVPGLR